MNPNEIEEQLRYGTKKIHIVNKMRANNPSLGLKEAVAIIQDVESSIHDWKQQVMNLTRLNRVSIIKLFMDDAISRSEYRDELNRRYDIRESRHQEWLKNAPKRPDTDHLDSSFELMLTCKANDGTVLYTVEFHRNRANMRLDDWNRVRVTFVGDRGVLAVCGVSAMHAILIAQVCGMKTVTRPDLDYDAKGITRRELGDVKTSENQKRNN